MKKDELLEIAKHIIELNSKQFALTGSLMCFARGIKTRREPTDIDMIGELPDVKSIAVPSGFEYYEQNGGGSDLMSVVFKHNKTGVKIDFLALDGEEFEETEDGNLVLANLQKMVSIKIFHANNDHNIESRKKHLDDLLELVGVMDNENYTRFCKLIETK